jgi:hypothetical protein
MVLRGEVLDPDSVAPLYLRRPQAVIGTHP